MTNKRNIWLIISGFLGFAVVGLGAFGAHALKSILSEDLLKTWQTGVLYHLTHTIVLLALTLYSNNTFFAKLFILVGIILFSFSLYIYCLTGIKWLVILTPFGGVSLMIGWLFIVAIAFKIKKEGI